MATFPIHSATSELFLLAKRFSNVCCADRCADLLRQKLMCDAGVGLIAMYWVKKHDHPYPDFNTYHNCRSFDAVVEWARDNEVDMGEGWKWYLEKPSGAVELEWPP